MYFTPSDAKMSAYYFSSNIVGFHEVKWPKSERARCPWAFVLFNAS